MSDVVPRRVRSSRWEPLTVGIDIGGTKVLGAVVDSSGSVIAVERRPTEGHDVRAVEDTIVDIVEGFAREYDVAAVGIGAAGFVDVTRTIVMFSPTSTGVVSRCVPRSPVASICPSWSTTTPTPRPSPNVVSGPDADTVSCCA